MTSHAAETSPRFYARVAGFGYVIIFIFTPALVLDSLIVPGDAATTVSNIMASELLFRLGIASWLFVLTADAIVAWALYVLLRPASSSLSLLAAWFRLVFVAIFGINQINLFLVLEGVRDTDYAQVALFLDAYNYGTHIGFVFFGIHILILGYLVFKSDYIPRILGVLLMVASLGYIIDSFANFLSSSYADNEVAFLLIVAIPAIIAELSLTLWLVFKGVNVERWKKRALESV